MPVAGSKIPHRQVVIARSESETSRSSRSISAAGGWPSNAYARTRLADLAHDRGGEHAVPGDVADRDHDAPVAERGRVVEVAADLQRLARRHVAAAQLRAEHVGQLAREQAALERERDVLHLARAVALAGRQRVAQPRDLEVGVDAGEQLGARERLDEVVVGAGVEALDGRLLARRARTA